MRGLICLFILFCSVSWFTYSEANELIELKSLDLDYKNYSLINPRNRPLLISPYSAKEGIDLGLKTDVLKYGYIDLGIETLTTDVQYRGVGLQIHWGANVTDYLQAGLWHHSQHVLEGFSTIDPYPVEDAIEIRVNLFRNTSPSQPIFGGH